LLIVSRRWPRPVGIVVLADGKRLLVALAGKGGFVIVDPKKGRNERCIL
jgi:hypothetical protein